MKKILASSRTLSGRLGPMVFAIAAQVLCSAPAISNAQTVLARARLGNNAEDMEFIPSGLYANQLAIIDGYDVLAIPVMGGGRGGCAQAL